MQTLSSPGLPHSEYFYFARQRLLVALTYRFEVVAACAARFILMVAGLYVWQAVYVGKGMVAGVDGHGMLIYIAMSSALMVLFDVQVSETIQGRIRSGDIAVDFIRPVFLPGAWLANDGGDALARMLIQGIPLMVGATLFVGCPVPASFTAFACFVPSVMLGFLIIWLMAASVALVAFWVLELGSLSAFQKSIVGFLSGSIVPIWFFPPGMQTVLQWLPFQYTYQGAIGIYVGKYQGTAIGHILLIQGLWSLLLMAFFILIWNRARRRVLVQGG